MKNKRIVAAIAFVSGLLAFAFNGSHAQNNVTAAYASVQQNVAAPQRGTLFRVRNGNSTAYLFGTIHVGQASFYPLEPVVTKALANADTLMVEFDIRNHDALLAATKKYALYPAGDSLDKHLSAETLDKLKQALQDLGIPFAAVAPMRPWMAANLLVSVALEHGGYEGRNGIDVFLLTQATAQHKAVRELESADYQMSLFEALSEKEQEDYLAENLADLKSGKLLAKTQELVEAWSTANGPEFAALSQEELDEKTATADFMQHVMIDQRNPEMAKKIEVVLQQKGTTFVGVGTLHLLGENGIPELLRKRGYAVEKLY